MNADAPNEVKLPSRRTRNATAHDDKGATRACLTKVTVSRKPQHSAGRNHLGAVLISAVALAASFTNWWLSKPRPWIQQCFWEDRHPRLEISAGNEPLHLKRGQPPIKATFSAARPPS
jgi:hypothetical protein